MPWWGWLIIVGVLGVALILVAALRDRGLRRRRAAMLTAPPPPVQGVEGGDARPHYVSLEEARQPRTTAPPPALSDKARALTAGEPVGLALADPGFATVEGGYGVAEHPIVLACAEPIATLRELYPALTAARNTEAALVIVAPSVDPKTLQTLLINLTQGLLHVIVVTGDATARETAASRCAARLVERSDLQAGYLPHDHLGGCPLWVSTSEHTWIAGADTGPPQDQDGQTTPSATDPLGSAE